MRVLVVCDAYPPDSPSGDEPACRQVVDALRSRRHDVRVLTSTAPPPAAESPHVLRRLRRTDRSSAYQRSHSAPATRLLDETESNHVSAFNVNVLLETLAGLDPDVVYLWRLTGLGGLGLLGALHHLRVPWVWHLLDPSASALCQLRGQVVPTLARQIEHQLRGHAIACGGSLLEELRRQGLRLPCEVELLPAWVAGPLPPVRTRFFRGGRPLRIGALAPRNGPEGHPGFARLIEAAALLPPARSDAFTIDLFGQGIDAEYIDLIKVHGLADRVRLVGGVGPSSLLAAAQDFDVFASAGTPESPGTFAPLEAGASGCVPILEPSSGQGEWLVHGVHCLKASDSPRAWARILTRVLDGRIDLAPIGRRIARAVRTDFALDRLYHRIEDMLMRAAQSPRDGAGTAEEVYRLALLAERLTSVLIQEPYCA